MSQKKKKIDQLQEEYNEQNWPEQLDSKNTEKKFFYLAHLPGKKSFFLYETWRSSI